jgi:hypothetical protein
MKIENLSKELDTEALAAVRGGDNGDSAVNKIGQQQGIVAPLSVMGYGPSNTSTHVNGTQNAAVWNSQISGDSFTALFPFVD